MWVIEDTYGLEYMQGKSLSALRRTCKNSNSMSETQYVVKPFIERTKKCTN